MTPTDRLLNHLNAVGGLDEPTLEHLHELQRFAEIGRLSASLLHEISNPLTAAILHLDPAAAGTSHHIRHARRHIKILQSYVEAARQQVKTSSNERSFFTRSQLEQVRRILEPHAKRHHVRLWMDTSSNYRLYGDAVKFQQIIANLVKNAIDAYATLPLDHSYRRVHVDLKQHGNWLSIEVTDWGLGMTTDELAHMFDPFYTTKVKVGHGLGIGLTVVKQYIESDFQGKVSATSTPGKGTRFTVKLKIKTAVATEQLA